MSSSLHFFTIPALVAQAAQEELNQFLATHRVVALEKQWMSNGADSAWAVCVTVVYGQAATPRAIAKGQAASMALHRNGVVAVAKAGI